MKLIDPQLLPLPHLIIKSESHQTGQGSGGAECVCGGRMKGNTERHRRAPGDKPHQSVLVSPWCQQPGTGFWSPTK